MPTLINDLMCLRDGMAKSVVQQVQWKHHFSACTHRTKLCASHLCGDSSSTHVNYLLQACQGPMDQTVNLVLCIIILFHSRGSKCESFWILFIAVTYVLAFLHSRLALFKFTVGKFSGSICSHHIIGVIHSSTTEIRTVQIHRQRRMAACACLGPENPYLF